MMTLNDLCAHLLPPDEHLKFKTLHIPTASLVYKLFNFNDIYFDLSSSLIVFSTATLLYSMGYNSLSFKYLRLYS